jgi:NAD(P)-dependent dehydrogenase (short-subunit alcohol dehydrogenase family)
MRAFNGRLDVERQREEGTAMGGELSGKVVVVTGAASGIGRGCAERFVASGAKVVVADVNAEDGRRVATTLGSDAAFTQTDVADADAVDDLVAFAVERFGGLDCMFNNAGISGARTERILDHDFSDFERVMAINVLGVANGIRAAARHMKDHGGGSIINTTSIGGMQAGRGNWSYAMSKASVIMLAQSAAIDLGEYGIRVNCIAPANIESPILGNMLGADLPDDVKEAMMVEVRQFLLGRQPIQRQGTTDDIAEAAMFFASDRSSYVTGQVMCVDGGMLTGNPAPGGALTEIVARYRQA